MRLLFADYETRSGADIGSVGLYKYMEDADFKPLLLAYSFDDAETQLIDFTIGEDYPDEFLDALNDPDVLLVGQNLQFERNVLRVHRGIEFPAERCIDTMILAASCGLPLSLAQICEALGMGEDKAKMKAGAALIRKFCCPRKPTKNNPKLWVDPEDAPEDWDTFCRYCIRDVDSERDVYRTLAHWMYPPEEVRFYALDSRINEKGVKSDITLARNAMDMDARYKAELTDKAIALTGMDNPSSVAQVKAWLLEQEGMEVPTLNKKAVAGVVEALQTDKAKEFMAIRTELSKTSTKKYDAFIRCACNDDHIRGCFQFFGGHTGRFAGRLVQLQNLPQNHLDDLDDVREIVKDGDYDFLRSVYPSVTNTLSELTRTTLIPEEGHKFCVADFSAIEARVSAWLTGEEWVLDSFRAGKDIYCATASQMFGVPVEKHGQNAELRQKGKIATLACIAEDQLVLTDKGNIPIQYIEPGMRVWDGVSWVSHDGLIYKGRKAVITYDGLTATPDHKVYTREYGKISLWKAASRGAHLVQAGDGWSEIRECGGNQPGETMERGVESLLCRGSLHDLRERVLDRLVKPEARGNKRLPKLLNADTSSTTEAEPGSNSSQAEMHESKRPTVSELRCQRNHLRLRLSDRSGSLGFGKSRTSDRCNGDRSGRQQPWIRTRESSLGNTKSAELQQEDIRDERVEPRGLAVCKKRSCQKTESGPHEGRDTGRCLGCGRAKAKELARHKGVVRFARTYDIVNAGPNHRFTVSGRLVSNCGYGGGVNSLIAFGADRMGLTNEEMAGIIDAWRAANPHIAASWKSIQNAVVRCITRQATVIDKVCGVRFRWDKGVMWMLLPSGREMAYYHPEYGPSEYNKDEMVISYMGMNQTKHKWQRIETRGSRIFENLVQATARDILREAMFSLDENGWDIRAHVHDEVICTEPLTGRSVDEMARLMCPDIPWAAGLPLRADGYECSSYRKD